MPTSAERPYLRLDHVVRINYAPASRPNGKGLIKKKKQQTLLVHELSTCSYLYRDVNQSLYDLSTRLKSSMASVPLSASPESYSRAQEFAMAWWFPSENADSLTLRQFVGQGWIFLTNLPPCLPAKNQKNLFGQIVSEWFWSSHAEWLLVSKVP